MAMVAGAALLLAARTGYADWYHDATTNYLEAASWLGEESGGDWHQEPWYLVGGEGDESCCSKFAESDPLYLDGTSASVSNEIVACRNLARNEVQGSFHVRADLGDEPDSGFRGFALYDFGDDYDPVDNPDDFREIIRFGIEDKEKLVYRVCGDDDYTTIQNGSLDDVEDGKPYEIGVDYNLSWVQLKGEGANDKSTFRFSLMDGYRERDNLEGDDDDWVPYRFDVRFDDSDWEVNAIGLIASKGTKILFSSVYVNTDPDAIPSDLRAPGPYDPGEPLPVRYEWGDEDGVYSIGSLDQLESLAVMLQECSFPDSTFTLIADIDCEGREFPRESSRARLTGRATSFRTCGWRRKAASPPACSEPSPEPSGTSCS